MKEQLYLVGQGFGGNWDFQGIFSTEKKAEKACRDKNYWYVAVTLDQECPHDLEPFPATVIHPIKEKR